MLPKQVNDKMGLSVPGEIVEAAGTYKHVATYQVAENAVNVKPGDFVRMGTNAGEVVGPANTSAVLGVVVRDMYYTQVAIAQASNKYVPAGENVTVLDQGVIAIEVESAANVGQSVLLSTAGVITFGNKGATGDTGFVVTKGCGAQGGIIYIKK